MSILIVGSVALDTVETPFGKREEVLGGSATFSSLAASFFSKPDIVAVVGNDFPETYRNLFAKHCIGTDGLSVTHGKTFRWSGKYNFDLNSAQTISTHLNVFSNFKPKIPVRLKDSKFIFLANIDPVLQHMVLDQVKKPTLIACDSMNFWIEHKKKELEKLLPRIDILLFNDGEARQFTGEPNLFKAAKLIVSYGPKAVVIKRGEHGVLYFSKNSHFVAPAYLLETVYDPTGAGDTFAGGMIGFLSKTKKIDETAIRRSIIYGSILASFAVEDFSVNRLIEISKDDIDERYAKYRKITEF